MQILNLKSLFSNRNPASQYIFYVFNIILTYFFFLIGYFGNVAMCFQHKKKFLQMLLLCTVIKTTTWRPSWINLKFIATNSVSKNLYNKFVSCNNYYCVFSAIYEINLFLKLL